MIRSSLDPKQEVDEKDLNDRDEFMSFNQEVVEDQPSQVSV